MSDPTPIRTLLVANRGEIARRVLRTARSMGLRTVAVFSDVDAKAPHVTEADVAVRLPGTAAAATYLDGAAVLAAAAASGADAIHPGYGFLSEDASFAEAVEAAGITWVGPPPSAMRSMAAKVAAKDVAAANGVPLLPSAVVSGDDEQVWRSAAEAIGFPLLVKASSGGGGRGMRRVDDADALAAAVIGGRREAEASFGDGTVFLERLLEAPRHVEVQVLADAHGAVLVVGERDCSVQRRHQKVIEEAPAPWLADATRTELHRTAAALATAIGYVGAGTVEYLVDGEELFFLEMNTRLQVEHPVTEEVHPALADLVEAQLRIAAGEALWVAQDDLVVVGHAIEARLYAEDPAAGYLPSPGTVHRFRVPCEPGIRVDAAVVDGSEVSSAYDPMIAKVIAHGRTRGEAASLLARALRGTELDGVRTNRAQLVAVLEDRAFLDAPPTTDLLDRGDLLGAPVAGVARSAHLVAVLGERAAALRDASPVQFAPVGFRTVGPVDEPVELDVDGEIVVLRWSVGADGALTVLEPHGEAMSSVVGRTWRAADERLVVEVDGVARRVSVRRVGDRWWATSDAGTTEVREMPRFVAPGAEATAAGPVAPVPGTVVAVEVAVGDEVVAGQVLVVLEAMKVEHRIESATDGVVEAVLVAAGDSVEAHQVLVQVTAP